MLPGFLALVLAAVVLWAAPAAAASDARPGLKPCWLDGVAHQVLCGQVRRPLDPARPSGAAIDIHFAVLPALARNRLPDPVFFVAGGPGQSAIDVADIVAARLSRLNNRRDLVLVDQRGTGRSAPLRCEALEPTAPLAAAADPAQQLARLARCRAGLQRLPHGDLRFFSTALASADLDAVRQALHAERINLVGGSYGTRAVLDVMRQFPGTVRRAVIDGVAPPDMALPAAASSDNQAALDAMLVACAAELRCRQRYPDLRAAWQRLLASLPLQTQVAHPLTGRLETLTMSRDLVLSLVRTPLYAPALGAGLPEAISEAARGRFAPLFGLSSAVSSRRSLQIAEGMHFSVVCSEDLGPDAGAVSAAALSGAAAPPALDAGAVVSPGIDFGDSFEATYRKVCADWPRASVPPDFYEVPSARSATLVLSGGADPVTPPRHGARVAQALGPLARHVVVARAGHGVLALPCLRDVLYRFIDAAADAEALKVNADCALAVPRPPAFVPLGAAIAGSAR